MSSDEILSAAREIVADNIEFSKCDVDVGLWAKIVNVCRELVRLHDGGQYSREPPNESWPHWWKPTLESSPRMFHVYQETEITNSRCREYRVDGYVVLQGSKGSVTDPYVLDMGGFWLRAEPPTATMLAELRAENERLKIVRCMECDLATIMPGGGVYCDECYSELRSDRDRLACELAEAKAALVKIAELPHSNPTGDTLHGPCPKCEAETVLTRLETKP